MGLGNPGPGYSGTRHNLGFRVIDELARRLGTRVIQKQGRALVGRAVDPADPGRAILLAKPQTFMNLSGRSATALLATYKLKPGDLWAIHDELDIPSGKLRIRLDGGAGGHNGVHSLIADLATRDFARFRLGVGRPDSGDPADWLLSEFPSAERERVDALVALAADAVMEALVDGIEISMNRHNGKVV